MWVYVLVCSFIRFCSSCCSVKILCYQMESLYELVFILAVIESLNMTLTNLFDAQISLV